MSPLVSIIITLLTVAIALKIALKVTGCLIKFVIFAAALWFILFILNMGFNFLTFMTIL
jgi:hypothetical protein